MKVAIYFKFLIICFPLSALSFSGLSEADLATLEFAIKMEAQRKSIGSRAIEIGSISVETDFSIGFAGRSIKNLMDGNDNFGTYWRPIKINFVENGSSFIHECEVRFASKTEVKDMQNVEIGEININDCRDFASGEIEVYWAINTYWRRKVESPGYTIYLSDSFLLWVTQDLSSLDDLQEQLVAN